MKGFNADKLLKNLGRTGTGGAIGTVLGIAVYFVVPHVRASMELKTAAGIGTAFGTAAAKLLEPVTPWVGYVARHLFITVERIFGWMTKEREIKFREVLQDKQYARDPNVDKAA